MTIQKIVRGGTGLTLMGIAVAAMSVDMYNNVNFAITFSGGAAVIAFIAALCVVALPISAQAKGGWNLPFKIAYGAALVVTVVIGHQAYNAKQDALLLSSQDKQETHETALKDATTARATLAEIKELGSVEELTKLANKASEEAKAKCAVRRKDACTRAQASEARAIERVSNAKARDNARALVDKADTIKASGSTRFASDNIEITRWRDTLIALALNLLTQLFAFLGHTGAELTGNAFTPESKKTQKETLEDWRKDERKAPRAKRQTKKKFANNVTPIR